MKKFIVITIAAIAALVLTSSVVKATVAPQNQETVELTGMSTLNFKMSMDRAASIFSLLPDNIRQMAIQEYNSVKGICQNKKDFNYQGVNVKTQGSADELNFTFTYQGYNVKVNNTSWEHLDQIFQ